MRTETRTVRIGENMGPIDWSYDFRAHFHCMGTSEANKDAECARVTALLRELESRMKAGERMEARDYVSDLFKPVLDIGMYDGWPYWRPTPSILLGGWLGSEWRTFDVLRAIRPSVLPPPSE